MASVRKKQKIPRDISYTKCRSYRNFIDAQFQADLHSTDWSTITECNSSNEAAENLNNILCSATDRHAPFIRLKMHVNAPGWLNGDLLAHIDEREHDAIRYDKCPCDAHLEAKIDSKHRCA